MSPIIDLDLPLPPTADQIAREMKQWALGRGETGLANYRHIFGPRKARELGVNLDELEQLSRELSAEAFDKLLLEKAQSLVISLEDFVQQMDEATMS
jgi:glutamine synthetase type III